MSKKKNSKQLTEMFTRWRSIADDSDDIYWGNSPDVLEEERKAKELVTARRRLQLAEKRALAAKQSYQTLLENKNDNPYPDDRENPGGTNYPLEEGDEEPMEEAVEGSCLSKKGSNNKGTEGTDRADKSNDKPKTGKPALSGRDKIKEAEELDDLGGDVEGEIATDAMEDALGGDEEVPMGDEMGGEEGFEVGEEASVEALVDALADAISSVTGVEVGVDADGDGAADDEMAALGGEEEPPMPEPEGGDEMDMMAEQFVAKVFARVGQRLIERVRGDK